MVQIILVLVGIFLLAKGNFKVSDNKKIERPASVFWGAITIIYGIGMSFLPHNMLYSIIYFTSFILVSSIFVVKAKKIENKDNVEKKSDTSRNVIILLVFIALVAVAFYFFVE